MEYEAKSSAAGTHRSACLIAGVYQDGDLPWGTADLDRVSDGSITRRRRDFDAAPGTSLLLFNLPGIKAERVLLVGLGPRKSCTLAGLRKAVVTAIKVAAKTGAGNAATVLAELPLEGTETGTRVQAIVAAGEQAAYRFEQMKSNPEKGKELQRLTLLMASRGAIAAVEHSIEIGRAVAKGVALARDLGNLAPNICTPTYLAAEARKLARRYPALKVRVLGEAEIRRLGMGAFLGVARGSREAPRLIVFEYQGTDQSERPLALVGKGLTFDAGGISLKPSANMDEMKYDMGGAAGVFGAVVTTCELGLKLNLVGIVPACENLPDGNAIKPGDVLTSMSGQTIEIINTDAEGRLILADALSYAERFKPRAVVDIATLTGACVVALGHHASGLMSPDDALADELLAAGERAGDRAWRLPLWEDYQSPLKSNFADFANVGGRDAGAITAGCFLWRFTKKYRWAHLDIAGTAWKSGKHKGGTGRPVGLLAEWLIASNP